MPNNPKVIWLITSPTFPLKLKLLKNNKIKDFKNIEYFFADDIDEYNFASFEFCEYLIKQGKKTTLYLDKEGCSRKGYLCGYDNAYQDLKVLDYRADRVYL